ncbi:MAG: F0F1 ATP synthase subunit epsilon [Fibrobacter sp.]|nr:F0F1 ATP synthase subunit epsilon [Fibrobacter sp.]
MNDTITLDIILPYQQFMHHSDVTEIIAETDRGSFGLLPHRLDCVATISPGIVVFRTKSVNEIWVAVDNGFLLKTGLAVTISVRNAFSGPDPVNLKRIVRNEFSVISDIDKKVKTIMLKLENNLIQSIMELHHG